jgi:hypothetical protein
MYRYSDKKSLENPHYPIYEVSEEKYEGRYSLHYNFKNKKSFASPLKDFYRMAHCPLMAAMQIMLAETVAFILLHNYFCK